MPKKLLTADNRLDLGFNVSQLLKEPPGSRREYGVEEGELVPSLEGEGFLPGLLGQVTLMRTDKSILASADLRSSAICSCSRCLEAYLQALTIHIEEEFFPTVDIVTGVRLDLSHLDEEDCTIDEHQVLDLTEAVRQYAIVSLPMKPLCKEDCAGICPQCGANLNRTPCRCNETPGDLRWGPLLELLPRSDSKKP